MSVAFRARRQILISPLLPPVLDSGFFIQAGIASAGASVHGEAGCIVCSQPRVLKALFPVAEGFELKLYECASCTSSLWLITRVSRSSARQGRKEGRPPGTRLTTIDAALEVAARADRSKRKDPPA